MIPAMKAFLNCWVSLGLMVGLAACRVCPPAATPPATAGEYRNSVVKIYVTVQRADYASPWQNLPPGGGTGSGFVIKGKKILTNAHVISDGRFIQVQKDGDPRKYVARREFVGHDCDLATLVVDDPAFFDGTVPVEFADDLPLLGDTVTVLGYPMGGDRLSLTRGVVSRIDYGVYSHSGADQHLVLQVDAAINPGNSGGPVLYKNRVVGLAFQGLSAGDNIGYAIPPPVLRHFLTDIADGRYHGYPELGVATFDLENAALRRDFGLASNQTGVAVAYIDPFGSAPGLLRERDVLLAIDGHPIADDGTIRLDGNSMHFAELLERRQWGETAEFRIWRDQAELTLPIPLTNPHDPYLFRNEYDRRPEFFILGGLVFCPLTQEYRSIASRSGADAMSQLLLYYSFYMKRDGLYKDREQCVVLTRRLPHKVNSYAEGFINGVVTQVNGRAVSTLRDVKAAAAHPVDGFHVLRFAGTRDAIVLNAAATREAADEIADAYGVVSQEYFEVKP